MFNTVQSILEQYDTISLDTTESIRLMNRIDNKYLLPVEKVCSLLTELQEDYFVLEIESKRFGQYHSVYYDTPDLRMFNTHIAKHYPRYKVRERTYSQNGLQFLEVKNKKPNGRTSKKRISLCSPEDCHTPADSMVEAHTPYRMGDLAPQLYNYFDRITLVNKALTERLTLDFNLQFGSLKGEKTPVFERAVVVELKQDKRAESVVASRLRKENIRQCGMSKYCIGTLLLNHHLSFKSYKQTFTKFLNIAQWT